MASGVPSNQDKSREAPPPSRAGGGGAWRGERRARRGASGVANGCGTDLSGRVAVHARPLGEGDDCSISRVDAAPVLQATHRAPEARALVRRERARGERRCRGESMGGDEQWGGRVGNVRKWRQ